jgi:hypothetical protein
MNADEKVLWQDRPLKAPFLMGALLPISIGATLVAVAVYSTLILWFNVAAIFFGAICGGIFLFFVPYFVYNKDWKDTEYSVTNQRIFFDTLSGYAIVNLTDVLEIHVARGVCDKINGTGRLFVDYRDFQRLTEYPRRGGKIYVYHKPPSFRFIKETGKVQEIIEDAADYAKLGVN